MSLTRHQKFRPVLIAGITAVVVGGTGAAFAATHGGSGSTDRAALASSTLEIPVSASATPTAGAGTTASPTRPAVKHHKKKHHKKKHRHGHRKPTASPTTTAPSTSPTASPSTSAPSTAPTKPSTPPSTSAPATTTAPSTGGSQTAQFQAQVLTLTNAERAKNGCDVALKANTALTKAAQDHAEDMLKNNYFDHNSQDGTSPFARMTAAGYKWSGAAENIAAGQPTPQAVVTSWMNSPGHRANILNCGLKDLGVGYAAGSGATYGQYWVQDFGSPLG